MPPSSDQDKRQPGRGRLPEPTAAAPPTLHFVLDVDWVSPSIARDRLRTWLATHRWSPSQTDDLVLALNEAVSNSIEHGYGLTADIPVPIDLPRPAVVEVGCRVCVERNGVRRVELTVRDRGAWRRPAEDSGTRGHGMTIMRACVEDVIIDRGAAGTTVVLRGRAVPHLYSPK